DKRKSGLFSIHITSDLDKFEDYITLTDHGKILFSRSKDDLLEGYALYSVKSQLLGLFHAPPAESNSRFFFGYNENREQIAVYPV
ncbi:MAG TPA: hypothetical protein VHR42_00620, partial [Clostridia bacterium]|nr:hypothetical protein [Clostridia bacterium]